jgi:hypothetical protein
MAQTFWTGSSLSFTNGSKIVTVNTGPSVGSIYPNSKLKSGNYNEPVEVKAAYGTTIELYENWPGSTGNASATITPSAAAAAAAGTAAQQVISEIQSLVGSASATATANSFVKRDSNGRIKAATPVANDDVVTKGHIGTAATRDATTDYLGGVTNQLLKSGDLLLGVENAITAINSPDLNELHTGGMHYVTSPINGASTFTSFVFIFPGKVAGRTVQFQIPVNGGEMYWRSQNQGAWSGWRTLHHSGNTNFNEFGGLPGDVVAKGASANSTLAVFYREVPFHSTPTGISVSGTFKIRNPLSNSIIATGVTPVFNAANSSRSVLVITASISGMPTEPGPLELVAETSTSITINL